jgi:hypothetical protein
MTDKAKILVVDDQMAVALMMVFLLDTGRLRRGDGLGMVRKPCNWLKRRYSI